MILWYIMVVTKQGIKFVRLFVLACLFCIICVRVHMCSGGNNHSPTRQMQVKFGIGEYFFKLTRQLGECFFPPLNESFLPR
jgi:hypothetical protein